MWVGGVDRRGLSDEGPCKPRGSWLRGNLGETVPERGAGWCQQRCLGNTQEPEWLELREKQEMGQRARRGGPGGRQGVGACGSPGGGSGRGLWLRELT